MASVRSCSSDMNLPLKTQNGPVVPAAYVGINTGGGQMAADNDQPLPHSLKSTAKGPVEKAASRD